MFPGCSKFERRESDGDHTATLRLFARLAEPFSPNTGVNRVKTVRWLLPLALLATGAYGGQVYRSTDANGNVVYSDRPTEKSEPVFISVPGTGRPGNPITPRDTKAAAGNTQASNGQTNASGDSKSAKPQTPAEKEAERAKNCATARERKTTYDQSHRLFKAGANGDRVYLSDGEIDEARARAAADVGTWCG
jgi:hypothetical protein